MNDGEWAKLPSSLTPYVLSQLSALHDHKRERESRKPACSIAFGPLQRKKRHATLAAGAPSAYKPGQWT